jgi:hypothetical protein
MPMDRLKFSALAAAVVAGALLAPQPASADPEVERFLARFSHEPTIREVQVAAIEYYNVSPSAIESLRTRARRKALVPGVSLGFTNSLSSYSAAIDDIIYRQRGIAVFQDQSADFLSFDVALNWSLDRLVFNAEQLDVMALIGIQDGVQREVTSLYYIRRRLQIELELNPPSTLEARLSGQLRLEELTGLLDAYTGGFFSEAIRQNQRQARARVEAQQTLSRAQRGVPTHGPDPSAGDPEWARQFVRQVGPALAPFGSAHNLGLRMR